MLYRLWVFADLTRVNNTVESGHYLCRCADWFIPWWVKLGELVLTSQSQDGIWWRQKVSFFLRMKYHTRLQWRQNSCVTKRTGWVGWIAQTSERGLPWGTEWYTHWVCYTVCQCSIPEAHTRHHANYKHALSRTRVPQLINTVHKTAQGMSSLKTSSYVKVTYNNGRQPAW